MLRNSRLLIGCLLLGGCVSQQAISPQQKAPAGFDKTIYTEAASGSTYKVDSGASQILITVRRGGLMASLGHDHIVASQNLQGFILIDEDSSQQHSCQADFYAPMANLEVDNAELRTQAGLLSTPSTNDINSVVKRRLTNFSFCLMWKIVTKIMPQS